MSPPLTAKDLPSMTSVRQVAHRDATAILGLSVPSCAPILSIVESTDHTNARSHESTVDGCIDVRSREALIGQTFSLAHPTISDSP